MDKRDLVRGIKDVLGDVEYRPISVGAGSVSLISDNSEIVFSYKKYPGIYILGTQVIGYKSFPEVEGILKPLYKKHKIGFLQYTIYKQSQSFEKLFETELSSISDLNSIGVELREMVNGDIIPFFEEYQNVSDVMEKVDSMPKEKISKFLNMPPLPRIMILKRINEMPDWKEYCEWAVDIYKTMASGPNGKQHESIKDLVEDLHQTLLTNAYS